MNMRSRLLLPILWVLAFVPVVRAQVEPNLLTKTDLIDVYQKNASQPEMVTIFDFTPPSRGVFEPMAYLTGKTRSAYLGDSQGTPPKPSSVFQAVFKPATLGKDLGMVFGYTHVVAKAPSNPSPATALGTSNIEIRMWWWPQTKAVFQDGTGAEVVGVP